MKSSLSPLWRPSLLLWMGLLLCCEARVNTVIQAGPLFRVVGSRLFISCNVSGFWNETAEKSFEFRVEKPSRPNPAPIISTADPRFGYVSYQDRISNKDIALTHVNPNSALFHIQNLLKNDEGEYECSVVDTEKGFNGIYSAKTTVKVIDNSLSVSSSHSTTQLNYDEGDALTLTCQASSNTIQHTHLSLIWYLHKDGQENAQPIISLDRSFTLSPGQGFEQRYSEGAISLDKLGEATYRLQMARLEVSDQGKIYCQAQEWIQDPDRSWYMIAEKDAEELTLTVKAREVTDMSSLTVSMAAEQTALQEGDELLLFCSIDTQDLEARFFSVAWLWKGVELARVGPTGILSVEREKEGEISANRIGNKKYSLSLKPVQTTDQGEFLCRAWLEERGSDGSFTQGAAQDSNPQLITISAAESELSVTMENAIFVDQSEKLRLVCKVSGHKDRLSVTWQHKLQPQTALFTKVISVNQDGVMETAKDFRSRKVRAMHPEAEGFVLELEEVTPSDSGVYQCTVTEWKDNGKTHSQSQSASVTVNDIKSLVKVSLKTRLNQVTVGQDGELMCKVQGLRVPTILSWSVEKNSSRNTIVTLSSDGAISWSGDQRHYQVYVGKQDNAVVYVLKITGASHREAGLYQCTVSVFLENKYKALKDSSLLMVNVQNPVSNLVLASSTKSPQNVNADIQINCTVSSKPADSYFYAVTWLFDNKAIVGSDRNAVVTFGPHLEQKDRLRISLRRINGPTFELTIRQATLSDKGLYTCKVVEWFQSPHGDWYSLPEKSVDTKLDITEPANDLIVDNKEQQLTAREGDEVELRCNISSDASALYYKVTWFYAPPSSLSRNSSLVKLDHTGLLIYPQNQELSGLQGRLRLSRPTQSSFYLRIQRAHKTDSGVYWCQVEQFQQGNEGEWKQKASKSSGPMILNVNVPAANLSVKTAEGPKNITKAEDFTIPCHVTQQSSDEAQFQVTWFRQKGADDKHPIFTAYRNSTFQANLRKDALRFDHPLPRHFVLTILKPGPDESGLYFCEVEEWLHSLSLGWRRVAMIKSENLNVTVYTNGNIQAVSDCASATWFMALVVTVIVSLLVIMILTIIICKTKSSGGKKSTPSLWVEQQSLNDKPSD